jgi:sporulation protein YlmC with PRC-barrel domain
MAAKGRVITTLRRRIRMTEITRTTTTTGSSYDEPFAGTTVATQPLPGGDATSTGGEPLAAGGAASGGAQIVGTPRSETGGPGPRLMTASTLAGDAVVNRQGEKLGSIDDIMIDVPSGRVAYAVMSSGGLLGIGDKLFAVPFNALTLDTDNKCFVLDVPRERIAQAPGFDQDHWPEMADAQWAQHVHGYYGTRPYWE